MRVAAVLLVVLVLLAGCDESDSARTSARPTPASPARAGTAGVTVRLPPGWHAVGSIPPNPHIVDPLARVVVSSAPVARRPSQCFIASYAPLRDAVSLVIVEWKQSDGHPPARPRAFRRAAVPLYPAGIECFEGRGGTVQFSERGRVFGAYVLLGRGAPDSLVDEVLSVLDTLVVERNATEVVTRVGSMPALADTSLTPTERRVVERFVSLLAGDFGPDLRSVWLYGSRARGEPARADSDVDLLVVSTSGRADDDLRAIRLLDESAEAEGASPAFFSVHVYSPALLAERRRIRSFFIQEVDRDKVVLAGEP